jgi:transcriptional regulator with XRE-family HTH domain
LQREASPVSKELSIKMTDISSVPENGRFAKQGSINLLLRQARFDRCWTIEEAAEAIGVSYESFYRWEHSLQRPRFYGLRHLQQIFGRSAEELGFDNLVTLKVVSGDQALLEGSDLTQ